MAIDQEAMDEHVRNTDELSNVDNFMGGFFRNDSDMGPIIRDVAIRRCNVTMTRPTTTRGVSHSSLQPQAIIIQPQAIIIQHAIKILVLL